MFWILFPLTTYVTSGLSYFMMTENSRRKVRAGPSGQMKRGASSSGHEGRFVTRPRDLPKESNGSGAIPTVAILLQLLASGLAFVHVVLGTMILSSLIFIGFHDTLKILARLIFSALVCRVIAMFELAAIRKEMEESARDDAIDRPVAFMTRCPR